MPVNSKCNQNKSTSTIFKEQENEMNRRYQQQILAVKTGTFTPLVFGTNGGMGAECQLLLKHLAEKLSREDGEPYAIVITWLKARLSFKILIKGNERLTSDYFNFFISYLLLHSINSLVKQTMFFFIFHVHYVLKNEIKITSFSSLIVVVVVVLLLLLLLLLIIIIIIIFNYLVLLFQFLLTKRMLLLHPQWLHVYRASPCSKAQHLSM